MSVLSEARGALRTIAGRFRDRGGLLATQDQEVNKASSFANSAKLEAEKIRGRVARVESDTKTDVGAIQQIVSQTETANRRRVVAVAQQAEVKAREAKEALAHTEEDYKTFKASLDACKDKVRKAKEAQAQARTVLEQTAGSL